MAVTSSHNHQSCIKHAFERADAICLGKGARFTPLRKRILELVWNNHKPAKAYDLLDILHKEDKSAKPMTVYRTLEFLQTLGLVHKIDSLNAYVGCTHPEQNHSCQFLICGQCGDVKESCDMGVFEAVKASAGIHHFKVERQMIEVHGVCMHCLDKA